MTKTDRPIQLGDFVEVQEMFGRIVRVDALECWVLFPWGIDRVPKAIVHVTVPIEDHLRIVHEWLQTVEDDD